MKLRNQHNLHYLTNLTNEDSKLYIPSTIGIQMNLVPFCFWEDWVIRAVLKISVILLNYITYALLLKFGFSYLYGQNEYKILALFSMHFLGQNRLNNYNKLQMLELQNIQSVLIVLGIYNFVKTSRCDKIVLLKKNAFHR